MPDTKTNPYIAKIAANYFNEKNQHIQEREVVAGTPPQDFPRFVGLVQISIDTPMGPFSTHLGFSLPGPTAVEAFAAFDTEYEKAKNAAVEELRRQQSQQKLIVPGQGGVPPLAPPPPNAGRGFPRR